jgi:hypothetical protein
MTLLALAAAAGWLEPELASAQSWNKAAFDTRSLPDAMRALGGGEPARSGDIVFFQTPVRSPKRCSTALATSTAASTSSFSTA